MNVNEILYDRVVGQSLDTLRFSETVRRRVVGILEALLVDLRADIVDADLAGVSRLAFRRRRAEALIEAAESSIDSAYTAMRSTNRELLIELTTVHADSVRSLAVAAFGAEDVFRVGLTPAEARQLVRSQVVLGGPAADFWSEQSQRTKRAFARQIRQGVAAGETNDQLVRRVVGRSARRRIVVEDAAGKTRTVQARQGGALSASRRDANALVRTSVQNVSNETLLATYRANDDIVRGVQQVSTLDGRTTRICISLSGGQWDLKTGKPLPESPYTGRFPGAPPHHYNCRSVLIPITRSWSELLNSKTGRSKVRRLDSVPNSRRASMDGQVAGNLTYPEWLSSKPRAFQREVLGPRRWQLWQDGKLDLHRLIDTSLRPLTLDELRARR